MLDRTFVETFWANIYVGFRVGRTGCDNPRFHTIDEARDVCQSYANEVKLCVTLTPTEYIYLNGGEPGCVVGLINYPRFPMPDEVIRMHALALAGRLKDALEQLKVSVVMPGETVMIGNEPESPVSQVSA